LITCCNVAITKVSIVVQSAPTICIVDDDGVVRDATADLINSLGYNAQTFASGEAFLESGQLAHISCLITDLQMPGLDGLELQSHLLDEGYRIPIIFITAFPTPSARQRAMNAGAVAFLSKPFEEASLLQSLAVALGQMDGRP
jgi:FixJ family two-component response regulator